MSHGRWTTVLALGALVLACEGTESGARTWATPPPCETRGSSQCRRLADAACVREGAKLDASWVCERCYTTPEPMVEVHWARPCTP